MKPLLHAILYLVLRLPSSAALADSAAFEQANKSYETGRYLEAIEAYQRLLTNSPTGAVHFNLGNAWYKSGQIGEAIAEYRLAEALSPRDPDVRANLKFARARVDGSSYRPNWLQEQVGKLSVKEWAAMTTGTIWIFFGLLTACQLRPGWARGLRSWTTLSGIVAAGLLAMTVWLAKARTANHMAVVVQREAVMRLGPFEESQSALNLNNGAELLVLDYKDNWLHVTPDRRQSGWIPYKSVRLLP